MYWTCWSWPIILGASRASIRVVNLLVKKYLAYWLLFSTVSYNVVFQIEFSLLLTGEDAPFRFCSSYHHYDYHCCSTQIVSFPGVLQQQFVISISNSGVFQWRGIHHWFGQPPTEGGFPAQTRSLQHGRVRHVHASHYCLLPPAVQDFLELGVLLQVLPRVSGSSSLSTASGWCTGRRNGYRSRNRIGFSVPFFKMLVLQVYMLRRR